MARNAGEPPRVVTIAARSTHASASIELGLEAFVRLCALIKPSFVLRVDPPADEAAPPAPHAPASIARSRRALPTEKPAWLPGGLSGYPVARFVVSHEGVLHIAPTEGFSEFTDAADAVLRGYRNESDYRTAQAAGGITADEIERFRASGFSEHEEYRRVAEAGYERALEACLRATARVATDRGRRLSLAEFCRRHVDTSSLTPDADTLVSMFELGYRDVESYRAGMDGRFADASEYDAARKLGIETVDEFRAYGSLGLSNARDLQRYKEFERLVAESPHSTPLAYAVATVAGRLKHGQSISVVELCRGIRDHREAYGLRVRVEVPGLSELSDDPSRIAALVELDPILKRDFSPTAEPPGLYRQWFTPAERETVVLDVSNIAWSAHSAASGQSASLAAVAAVIRALDSLSFSSVIGIADATLPYQIDDSMTIDELRTMLDLTIISGNQSADPHILDFARNRQALIVSNDRYHDWLERDAWRKANVPRIVIRFTVADGVVTFEDKIAELRPNGVFRVSTARPVHAPRAAGGYGSVRGDSDTR